MTRGWLGIELYWIDFGTWYSWQNHIHPNWRFGHQMLGLRTSRILYNKGTIQGPWTTTYGASLPMEASVVLSHPIQTTFLYMVDLSEQTSYSQETPPFKYLCFPKMLPMSCRGWDSGSLTSVFPSNQVHLEPISSRLQPWTNQKVPCSQWIWWFIWKMRTDHVFSHSPILPSSIKC